MGLSHLKYKIKHKLIKPITNNHALVQIVRLSVNRHYRLVKTCCVRSKRRDQHQSDNRETQAIKLNPLNTLFTLINIFHDNIKLAQVNNLQLKVLHSIKQFYT